MASGPDGTEPLNYQTWVLKISIHCEGCKKKIKKILHKVKGVHSIEIDAQQNRVTVSGNVEAESLVQKLLKYGKHAEVLPEKNSAATNSSTAASAAAPAVKIEPKGNEKAGSAAAAVAAVSATETEEEKKAEKGKAAESPESPPATGGASKEVTDPKAETVAPPQLEKSVSEKPAAADAYSKKKGKEVEKREENKQDEREVSTSGNVTVANPPAANPSPANIQPIYTTVSYHTANPSTSYAYYAAPPPEMPSNYAYYGNLPPPPNYPPPAGYSPDYYYSSESYYQSLDQPSSSAGSYDMFNDENPNACKLM